MITIQGEPGITMTVQSAVCEGKYTITIDDRHYTYRAQEGDTPETIERTLSRMIDRGDYVRPGRRRAIVLAVLGVAALVGLALWAMGWV